MTLLKKTYNTFKGEHIDNFDRTFIEKGKQWHLLSQIIGIEKLFSSIGSETNSNPLA